MRKTYYFFLLVFLISSSLFGQKSQSAQQVYIHTDQPYYLAGESINYATFLFNIQKDRSEDLNEIIHVKLFGNNVSVSDRIISKKSIGNGTIVIPDSTNSGDLILMAYTNSMKETDIRSWYKKRIKVFNQNDRKLANCDEGNFRDIQFYPESGQLIDGIKSKIVITSTAKEDMPKTDSVVITQGKKIVYKSPLYLVDLQSFDITPDSAKLIRALIYNDKDSTILPFPKAFSTGVSMYVENNLALSYLKIHIQNTEQNPKNHSLKLIRENDQYLEIPVVVSSKVKEVIIPYNKLRHGLNAIRLDGFTNVQNRLVFIDKSGSSKIMLSKNSYKPREAVNITFKLQDFASGSISVSKRPKSKIDHTGLKNFLSMESKLPIYKPVASKEKIDNLLIINQGNLQLNPSKLKSASPSDSMKIKGLLINAITNKPLVNNTVTVTFPEQEEFYTTNTNSEGRIDLSVKIGAGQYFGIIHTFDQDVFNKIIFKPEFEVDSTEVSIDLCNQVTYSGVPERWTRIIENQVIQAAYTDDISEKSTLDLSLEFLEDLYDKEVNLDDYLEQKTMKTVFSGIVPQVSISNNPNKPFKMFPMESSFSFGNTPLFYVDGIPTYNEEWILQMKPASIEKISVIASAWKLAIFGKAGSCGIISIETKEKNQKPPLSQNIFKMKGYSYYDAEPFEIKTNADDRIPAIKTLLYWNPNLEIRKGTDELLIKTGDEAGTYIINFEGFTATGEPISLTESFEVK